MTARTKNFRANKNSANALSNKSNMKEPDSSINEDYYRRINIQPAVVDAPMSPRTAKWVRELTPVLEPYNFNLNEISDLIHRCHYDANQIELAVGNVIEDFSGRESGQWTKVGKNRSNGGLKNTGTNNMNVNNNNVNRNKNFNNNYSIKSGKQTYSQNIQNQNHVESTNTSFHNKSSSNRMIKQHGHGQNHGHVHGNTQNQSHSHQARTSSDRNPQQESSSSGPKSTVIAGGSNNNNNNNTSVPKVAHASATKTNISNNPVDNTTTWAKLARKNNNVTGQSNTSYNKDNESLLENSRVTNNNINNDDSANNTLIREKLSQDQSVSGGNQQKQQNHNVQTTHNVISKPSGKTGKDQECSSYVVSDHTQSSSPSNSNFHSSDSKIGSGITAIDLGIKVGGMSPPHGIQIGGGIDYKSQGIGVFLPEGRTIDPNANDGLLFGSFGAVDISKIPENQIQINNSIVSDINSNTNPSNSTTVPANSSNTIGGGYHSNFGNASIGAMSTMTATSENNTVISGSGVSGSHLLNGWNASGSSPSKENSTNSMMVDQGLLHQNVSQRNNNTGVSGNSGVSGSNIHTSIKSSGIGNGYIGHPISGNAVNNYNNLPITGQGMVSTGSVYSSNPALLSSNNGMNYNDAVVGGGTGSSGSASGNVSNGNSSNMALAAAAAAAAAVNPYNYAYLNYAGYTANFPYMVGNTAAFGFPHYNTKPNGHHHPTPVFNQYSQGPNPNQHGLNGVYGIGGTGNSGNTTVNNSTSGNVMVSEGIGVNYHTSNNQSPISMGGNSTHNHHISSQNPSSYQNIQSMLPPGISHQQVNMGSQQPNVSGNTLQNQMNLQMGFNNNGGSNEFGVDQAIPQTVFLGQPGNNSNKLDSIGAHPGDFINHQGYNNHHNHIQNPSSNANINSQGNPNSGNPNNHAKGNGQTAGNSFQGNIQYIGKPTGSGSSNTGSGTPSGTSGNSASGNPSGAVNGATVGTGMDLAHQSQGVGGNTGSSNSSMFLSGRAQNTAGQAGQVGSGQSKQTSVNFPGFHSSRAGNNSGFLQHNNNMWNNN